MPETRYFYHSFPRQETEDEPKSSIGERGWKILLSMKQTGLILAPELVEWNPTATTGPPASSFRVQQRRISFTELAPGELKRHSEHFGPFAIEFDIATLRRLGATPVVYMPQDLGISNPLSFTGSFVVGHLDQIWHLLSILDSLDQNTNHPSSTTHIPLNSGGESWAVEWQTVRNLLACLQDQRAPFGAMLGAIEMARSLLYPADEGQNGSDTRLVFYHQREWRITGGHKLNGQQIGRKLSPVEKQRLLVINEHYWGGQVDNKSWQSRRVDEALVFQHAAVAPTDWLRLANRIIVPKEYLKEARHEFGDIVTASGSLKASRRRLRSGKLRWLQRRKGAR